MGLRHFPAYLELRKADMHGQSDYEMEKKVEGYQRIQEMYERLLEEKPALTVRELAVNGGDLKKAGIPAGPEMGRMLEHLLQYVLEDPERNTKEELLAEAGRTDIFG